MINLGGLRPTNCFRGIIRQHLERFLVGTASVRSPTSHENFIYDETGLFRVITLLINCGLSWVSTTPPFILIVALFI